MGAIPYSEITPLEPEWRIPGLVPKSFLTIIMGDGGVGKGQLWADWAGRISRGAPMPLGDTEDPEEPGTVLLVTSEDDPNMSTAWRLRAAQADLTLVLDVTEDFAIPDSLAELAKKIDEIPKTRNHDEDCTKPKTCDCPFYPPVSMVVIDPLADNLGLRPDTHRQISLTSGNVTLRKYVMRPLEKLARSKGIELVVIHHTRKDGKMAGAKAISDAARQVLRITQPDETVPLRVITVDKSNIAGKGTTVGYTLTGKFPDLHVEYVESPDAGQPEARKSTGEKVLDLLQKSGRPLKTKEIALDPDVDAEYNAVRTALTRLKEKHKVTQPDRGEWAAVESDDKRPVPA